MSTIHHHRTPSQELVRSSLVWDNHGCLPLRADAEFLPQLARYRDSGVSVASINVGFAETSWMEQLKALSYMRQWIGQRPEIYRLVRGVDDVRRCKGGWQAWCQIRYRGMFPSGINANGGMSMMEPEAIEAIVAGLARERFSDADIHNILGENWLRIASQVWR